MFRRYPRRSPFRIDQTANWQVNELSTRMIVAGRISPSGSRMWLEGSPAARRWFAAEKRVAK